jgi:hypothetical protein
MRKTPTGRVSSVCKFCDDQARLEKRHQREKKPKPLLTMLRNIDPELRKLEATMRQAERRNSDIRIKLSQNVSRQIYLALKGKKDLKHWEDMVGYKITDLMNHLEKQFTKGMNWENYGEWEIDHIVPIIAWNFSSYSDIGFMRCWNYRNLRPLWGKENRKKGGSFSQQYQFEKMQELIEAIPEE